MILEGIVLLSGQHALVADLEDGPLPGVLEGVERVEKDERWHIGFGLRCLIDAKPAPELVDEMLAMAEDASGRLGRRRPGGDPRGDRADVSPPAVDREADRHWRDGLVRPSRVGLTGVETVVRLGVDQRSAQPFSARIECTVEPDSAQPTARFEDDIRDAIHTVVVGAAGMRAERLAQEVAERVRERRLARRVEVTIAARFPERRPAPVSGVPTQEISTLHARAMASARGTRWMVGVSAQGLTTAPDAKEVIAARSHERLAAGGFSEPEIARVLASIPGASHDQRSIGTLHLGCPEDCALEFDVAALLEIVEGAMSSEIFELMKRSDEGAVVERAHQRPRAVDDCVRAMISDAVERFADLPDSAFVAAAQVSTETIRHHQLTVDRAGLLGELRRELRTGEPTVPQTSMRQWLTELDPL